MKSRQDLAHGHGRETGEGGEEYTGDFEHGARAGHGECKYSDGGMYVGQWLDGHPHGRGHRKRVDEEAVGEFARGQLHGSCDLLVRGVMRYKGQVENEVPHGDGEADYEDGARKYSGQWRKGLYHGVGLLEGHGWIYEGEWSRDCRPAIAGSWMPPGTALLDRVPTRTSKSVDSEKLMCFATPYSDPSKVENVSQLRIRNVLFFFVLHVQG